MAEIDSTFTVMATKLEIRKIYTPLYYGTNKWIERGFFYKVAASRFNPEYIVFHPDDFALVDAALPLRILTPINRWHPSLTWMTYNPEVNRNG